jgi:hypothetical protein
MVSKIIQIPQTLKLNQNYLFLVLIDFCTLMIKLHSCSATSAGIERTFSTFALIWTKLRNNLGVDKVLKLVQINKCINNNHYDDDNY